MPSFSIFQVSADPLFNPTFVAVAEFSVDIIDNDGTLSDPDADGSQQFDTAGLPGAINSANTQVFELYNGTAGGQPVEFILIRFSAPPLIVLTQGVLAPGQTLSGVAIATFNAPPIDFVDLSTFVCFAGTTRLSTPDGPRPIADIRIGEKVCILGGTPKPVKWIARRTVLREEMTANPKLCPVRITVGALGNGVPSADLLVSRQHRILVSSNIAERVAGTREVLVAAIRLTALPNIFVDETIRSIQYVHLAFDRHEVIVAEDAPAESFLLGAEARKSIHPSAARALEAHLPSGEQTPRFPIPTPRIQRTIIARHVKNRKSVHPKPVRHF